MLLVTTTNKASAGVMMTDLHPLWGTAGGASSMFSIPNPVASWGCPTLRFSGSTSHSSPSGYTGVGSERHTMVPSSSTSLTVDIHHAFCQKPCHGQHSSGQQVMLRVLLRVCAAYDTDHCIVDCSQWQRSATSTIWYLRGLGTISVLHSDVMTGGDQVGSHGWPSHRLDCILFCITCAYHVPCNVAEAYVSGILKRPTPSRHQG